MDIAAVRMQAKPAIMQRSWMPLCWLGAALLLFALQLATGTEPLFAGLVFLFAVLSYHAVRAAGGLTTLMGACVAFMAGQNVLVSQVAKVALGQAADHPLLCPLVTISLYDLAMAAIWLAAVVSARWAARRKPLFRAETDVRRLMWLAYISAVFSVAQVVILGKRMNADTGHYQTGGIYGPLSQIFYLMPLAVASGTAYVILTSKGRRSIGPLNAAMILLPIMTGIASAGREGMVTGVIIYAATCLAFRFRFRPIHFAVALGAAALLQYILFPYALYARTFVRTPRMDENVRRAASCLMDVISDPAKYQHIVDKQVTKEQYYSYYGTGIPSLDRASLIEGADAIIYATLQQGPNGMATITPGFYAAIPRIFYPDKPFGVTNALAHRAPKMVGKDDHTTGITLGWVCEAFSSFGWLGVAIIPFVLSLSFFASYRFVLNDRMLFNVVPISLLFHLPWEYSGGNIASVIVGVLQDALAFACIYCFLTLLVDLAMRAETRIRQAKLQARSGAVLANSRINTVLRGKRIR